LIENIDSITNLHSSYDRKMNLYIGIHWLFRFFETFDFENKRKYAKNFGYSMDDSVIFTLLRYHCFSIAATTAKVDNTPVFKIKAWRNKGVTFPFCSQYIPMEVINHPRHRSICYHPSLLPRHRGASAI